MGRLESLKGFKTGDKVKILPGHPNAGCITNIKYLYDTGDSATWAAVEGNLKFPACNAPVITEIEHYGEETVNKFKVGDKVKLIGHHYIDGNEVSGLQHIVGNMGVVKSINEARSYRYAVQIQGNTYDILESDLKKESTMDNLVVGTLLLDGNGACLKSVVAIDEDTIYTIDLYDNSGDVNEWTLSELKQGYHIKGQEPDEPEVTELTLAQVAEKVGIPVDQLRIKE